MDPQATLNEALRAMARGDRDGALDHLSYLVEWISRDGFLPQVVEDKQSWQTASRGTFHVGHDGTGGKEHWARG